MVMTIEQWFRQHVHTVLYALDAAREQRLDLVLDDTQRQCVEALARAYDDLVALGLVSPEEVAELHQFVRAHGGAPMLLDGVPPRPN